MFMLIMKIGCQILSSSHLQEWALTKEGQVKHLELCITLSNNYPGSPLKLQHCANNNPNQVRH